MNSNRTPRIVAAFVAAFAVATTSALAVCPAVEIATGLHRPLGVALSNQGNLIVSETGTMAPNSGRIVIVEPGGSIRPLITGMPSGIEFLGEPSGVGGVFMRGRTLFVAVGVGDVAVAGPAPGTALANPNPLSSPLFSSVLAIHFSAAVEKSTQGFVLTLADQNSLAAGQKVTLTNAAGEKVTVQRAVDFQDYVSTPTPTVPGNIRFSNPYDLVVVDDVLFVTDASHNCVRKVDLTTGAQSVLATFPNIPNPMFNPPIVVVGPPTSEAVPTGIREMDGMLLITLFRGVPFAPGTSNVVAIDPTTGAWESFVAGLKTAIDVISMPVGMSAHDYFVIQHASVGPFFGGPGLLLGFDADGGSKTVVADCLQMPTSMALDAQAGVLYITELGGRVLAVPME